MVSSSVKATSLYIVRIALIAALLTASKFALSFIPNVEIVTLLIMIFSASFGTIYMLPATLVFCSTEILIYGIQSWVILYFIFWPLLAIMSSILLKRKSHLIAVLLAIVFSILFGIMSAGADTIFCMGYIPKEKLGSYFVAYYLRGIVFDIIHLVSNFVIVLVLFKPLIAVCRRIMPKAYSSHMIGNIKMFRRDYIYIREDRNETSI